MNDEELKKMTVADVIGRDEFLEVMREQISLELGVREKAMQKARALKMRLQRNVIDSLLDKEVMDAETMRELYKAALCKSLVGFSSVERSYINTIGLLCYSKVIGKLKEGGEDGGAA